MFDLIKRILVTGAIVAGLILGALAALTVLLAPTDAIGKFIALVILAIPVLLIIQRRWAFIAAVVLQMLAVLFIVIVNWPAIFNWVDGALKFVFDPATRRIEPIVCYSDPGCAVVYPIVFSLILFFVVLTSFAYTTFLERRVLARLQHRVGPNRVGPDGWLQPAADGVKLIFKEDIRPAGADYLVYLIAPLLKTIPTLIILAVIPLGPDILIPWFAPSLGDVWYRVPLGLTDPNVGVLWVLAITSLGTYGVVLAGWSSDNKYAMLGGLRASAQMISYELSLGLALIVPILIAGSLSVGDIVRGQTMIWDWYIFQNPLAAAILLIALLAEVNRAPFDLPEAEQELTAGYMTEYSGMKFAMFMMAEYLGMIAVSAVFASVYLGGFNDGFGLVNQIPILGPLVLAGKIFALLFFMIWIRATLPRIRYDRLMHFGWKVMLPLALLAVCWTAISVVIGEVSGNPMVYGAVSGIIFVLVLGGAYYVARRNGEAEAEEVEDIDPMISGERRGVGYAILSAVGSLIAILFGLVNLLTEALEKLSVIGQDDEKPTTTAIEPADNQRTPVKGGD